MICDQATIDEVQAIFTRIDFSSESTQVTRTDLPAVWQTEGTKEYAVRSARADAVLADIRKAISADTGKFSWTVTPKLAPRKR